MPIILRTAPAGLALALAACGGASIADTNQADQTQATAELTTPAAQDERNDVPAAVPLGETPAQTTSVVPSPAATGQTTPDQAAGVVESYYAAIDSGNFDRAYALWDRDGQASNQTLAQFKNGFAETASTSVKTGTPTNGEGAAGSVYIDVPVTVTATLKDGTKQRFTGTYTLRRINDVPGATPKQLSWHLASAKLKAG